MMHSVEDDDDDTDVLAEGLLKMSNTKTTNQSCARLLMASADLKNCVANGPPNVRDPRPTRSSIILNEI